MYGYGIGEVLPNFDRIGGVGFGDREIETWALRWDGNRCRRWRWSGNGRRGSRRCWWGRARRRSRCYARRDAHVVNVLLGIEGGGIRDIAAGIVRNDCHVIAQLVLVRITEKRIERRADRDVGRPGVACVQAVGIEELRIGVVRGVPRVEPNGIDPSIRRDRQRAEPVPFAVIDRIVVDPLRSAKG